ncbi:MAG: phage baseplate protein [Plesiomonas shigelloides]
MSIVNLFTRGAAPTIGGYSFDAVLEDTLDISVELTSYPVESGARVNDHRIINPIKWSLTGAVSNNPLTPTITDFLGGTLSNLTDNPYVATVAGLSAGWLAGSAETRSSTTLQLLIGLMMTGDPFYVDAGDIQLNNMVITRLSRGKDPSNEGGLIFVAELQELISLDRLPMLGQPQQYQLRKLDPAQSAVTSTIKKGQQMVRQANKAVNTAVNNVLGGIF